MPTIPFFLHDLDSGIELRNMNLGGSGNSLRLWDRIGRMEKWAGIKSFKGLHEISRGFQSSTTAVIIHLGLIKYSSFLHFLIGKF